MSRIGWASWGVFLAAASFFAAPLSAQTRRQPLITERIDESVLHTLAGNTRPEANPQNDRGAVADGFSLEHMLLQLQRSPEQEDAVRGLIDDLHNSRSGKFHQWLTAEEFGKAYAPAQEDLDKVTAWLESHGFTVNVVYSSGMAIDFSGTAAQVRDAFHTSIHYYDVSGVRHIANASDPRIPAALAPVVAGVVSMHDFRPRAMKTAHRDYSFTSGGTPYQAIVPADLATIYDLTRLFNAGYTGKGQTVAVIEDTNLHSTADWSTFRSTFGLTVYSSGSLTTVHPAPPTGRNNCGNPGVNSDDGEATLDAEWASAAAPGAAIEVVACADTYTTFGGFIAMQNLINSSAHPSIMSISYGECEAENGASSNASINALYQQAVVEGISVFVSAGDEGAASCDADMSSATHGIGVSAFATTGYNVAVGGTDFSDTFAGANSKYWSSSNSSVYGSALSYIPEIPWNDSCAGGLLSEYLGFTATSGPSSLCATTTASQDGLLTVTSGSGGPSGCATGSPVRYGVVGGTCKGYVQPSWQVGVFGLPTSGVRVIPDVSLFAANGLWGHYYVFCFSDASNGGAPCVGAPSGWAGAGGTSFSSPIMAGIQALVNQKQGGPQGNPNYVYYRLAAQEFGASGSSTCNSSNGASAASAGCIFHDVTQGDMVVNCAGSSNCYGYVASQQGHMMGIPDGALSVSDTLFTPAYGTATGWDFATGIGTVDAFNLVMSWIPGL
jgi:subtilase family serine protease